MICMQHSQQYSGPLCPECVAEITEAGRPATIEDVRRIVREELGRMLPHTGTCPKRFTAVGECTCRRP